MNESNSLIQYLDLYDRYRSVIVQHSPACYNKKREEAFQVLKKTGRLPEQGDENYPVVSLNKLFEPDYGLNISRVDFGKPKLSQRCETRRISGHPAALIVNDSFVKGNLNLPSGLELCSIAEAYERYPECFACEIADSNNTVVAINDLFVQDGVFIRVSAGAKITTPIQVLCTYNSLNPMLGIRRVKVVVEDGAQASLLLCDHPSDDCGEHLSDRVVEVTVGENASFDFFDLEEAGDKTRRVSVFASEQRRNSRLNVCSLFLNGGVTRNEYYPKHLGENCFTRLGGMVIGGENQIVDNYVRLTHEYSNCTSQQLFKYALFGKSMGSFEGLVKVEKGAEHSDAHQNNRNLLISSDARMYAMPQLEIYCDEVKASHGSATGQLDEDALFYMRSRGIPEAEARMMLVNAFMSDVLDTISNELLRERLRHLVEVRLRGSDEVCSGCNPTK